MSERRNIQFVSDSYLCSNCGACYSACGKKAINLKWSQMGRLYASVNGDLCVDCGVCLKVCPSLNEKDLTNEWEDRFLGRIEGVYVGRATDSYIYKNAQSGGACTAILSSLFKKGLIDAALVCQMTFGDVEPRVNPVIVTSAEELKRTQKSCYTPVSLLTILNQCKSYKSVALVGLPCHIQGLVLLQKHSKRYDNFKYKLGLICDRTLCKGIQDINLSMSGISGPYKIDWRRKDFKYAGKYYPYATAPVVLYNDNGDTQVFPNYYRIALKEMFTPPRCRVCYDKLATFSDITLGDPWSMSGVDGKHGDSLVIVRTKLGYDVIKEMLAEGDIYLKEQPIEDVIQGQHINRRKKEVKKYSFALNELLNVESYLLEQHVNDNIDCDEERKILKSFIYKEECSDKDTIRAEALELISQQTRNDRRDGSYVKRASQIIIRLIKRILKK